MAILDRVLRAGEGKKVKALGAILPEINALSTEFAALSDDSLRAKTAEFKSRVERGETLDDLLIEAFALSSSALMISWRGSSATWTVSYFPEVCCSPVVVRITM